MRRSAKMGRRRFLKTAAGAAVTVPCVVPASVLGLGGAVRPSERITLGAIGLGGRGRSVLSDFLKQKDVHCLAVCDCYADRRKAGKAMVDGHYGNKDCVAYRFHEDLLARDDVDAVLIAAGDRWHTPLSILAARAGKDVYCEKPSTLTIAEGRALVETTRRYGTVWQCGTQRRSNGAYQFVVDVIRRGRIGRLQEIATSFGGWGGNGLAKPEPEPPPEVFDYDRWLGQAPWAPYSGVRVKLWRNHWDTGAGPITDMGPHYLEYAQLAHDSQTSGPVDFEGEAVWPDPDKGFANVPFEVNVRARYADGVRIVINTEPKAIRYKGDRGWIRISDSSAIEAEPKSVLKGLAVPRLDWSDMGGHVGNFLGCVRSRDLPVSHPEIAHRAHTIAHCANISLRLGRPVRWDPKAERFVGDDEANHMRSRAMRAPWRV